MSSNEDPPSTSTLSQTIFRATTLTFLGIGALMGFKSQRKLTRISRFAGTLAESNKTSTDRIVRQLRENGERVEGATRGKTSRRGRAEGMRFKDEY